MENSNWIFQPEQSLFRLFNNRKVSSSGYHRCQHQMTQQSTPEWDVLHLAAKVLVSRCCQRVRTPRQCYLPAIDLVRCVWLRDYCVNGQDSFVDGKPLIWVKSPLIPNIWYHNPLRAVSCFNFPSLWYISLLFQRDRNRIFCRKQRCACHVNCLIWRWEIMPALIRHQCCVYQRVKSNFGWGPPIIITITICVALFQTVA